MDLYSRFVLNTLLRGTILISCIVIIILMGNYMASDFIDNFSTSERILIKNPDVYGSEEQWHLLLAIAVILAFFLLLLQCLGCLATLNRAKGRLDTPRKARMIRTGERVVELFGAVFSFICLMTAAIRLSDMFRYDPVCGVFECEFRNRLVTVAALYFINTILFGGLILISMHQHEYFRVVEVVETAVVPSYGKPGAVVVARDSRG